MSTSESEWVAAMAADETWKLGGKEREELEWIQYL